MAFFSKTAFRGEKSYTEQNAEKTAFTPTRLVLQLYNLTILLL